MNSNYKLNVKLNLEPDHRVYYAIGRLYYNNEFIVSFNTLNYDKYVDYYVALEAGYTEEELLNIFTDYLKDRVTNAIKNFF